MEVKCRWCHICAKENLENIIPDHLQQLLPEGHCHFICTYKPVERGFTACIKLQLATREEAEVWLEDFQRSSRVTLTVDKTYPITKDTVRRNSYRVDMKCQHNTRQTRSSKTNTHCPAVLYLVLKKHRHSQNRKSRSSDTHIQEGLLLHVTVKHHHNHSLGCSEALQHRDEARETVEKLEKLFQSGQSPSSPRNTLKYELHEEQGDSYVCASADGSICPDVQFGSGAAETSSPSESVAEHLKGRLRSMFDDLVDKLEKDLTFQAPIESLVSSYENIHTDSGLISALSTFGKMRSAAAAAAAPAAAAAAAASNIKMQPRKRLQMSTQIGVRPTAVACRKTPLGGRRALVTGRPPKRARREQP
ncbi:uncharacterized protein si:dkey-75a21.2 [Solea solea]|uniref:uncharacterized protein si:dkey-75a21.2 n=1 Tax=Solea solea TaxID=90069 RepID=UPI00272C6578|nr:uncharacterized protein si:dkey-75a21.2 [Solea solea]